MAGGINKVILIGNLGKDPEVRFTPGGQAVANFNIATSESWNDKTSGQKVEKTEWHRIVVWGKLAELCGEYHSRMLFTVNTCHPVVWVVLSCFRESLSLSSGLCPATLLRNFDLMRLARFSWARNEKRREESRREVK